MEVGIRHHLSWDLTLSICTLPATSEVKCSVDKGSESESLKTHTHHLNGEKTIAAMFHTRPS